MDLSQVRSLDIDATQHPMVMKQAFSSLVNLETLFINVYPCPQMTPASFMDVVKSIFHTLPPLKYLCVRALREVSLLDDIATRHGQSLRGLMIEPVSRSITVGQERDSRGYLYPRCCHVDVEHLAESFPHLRELRIPIQRSKGDHRECQIYRALGNFSELRSLILDLGCNPPQTPDARQNVYDIYALKDALVNAAVDKSLARAIWDVVFSSQETGHLQNLRCGPFGGDLFGREACYVFQQRARSFIPCRATWISSRRPSGGDRNWQRRKGGGR